jgi:hypothetical protein
MVGDYSFDCLWRDKKYSWSIKAVSKGAAFSFYSLDFIDKIWYNYSVQTIYEVKL